jgi:hypothetical protein
MHKAVLFLFLTAGLFSSGKAETLLPLKNGNFEEGKGGWTDDKGVSQVAPEAAQDGKGGLRVVDPDALEYMRVISDPIAVLPGKTYRLSFQARQVSGHGVNGILYFLDSEGEVIKEEDGSRALAGPADDGDPNWKIYQVTSRAPANAASAQIYVQSNRVAVAVVDFDEFKIEQTD